MLISVTDHAVERYLQRVRGVLDPRPEIAGRVRAAWEEGSDAAVPREFTDALRSRGRRRRRD